MAKAETHIGITFEESTDARISLELDEEMNAGETRFPFGNPAYVRCFHTSGLQVSFATNAGNVRAAGQGVVVHTETVRLEMAQTADLEYPADRITSFTWQGRSLGGWTQSGPSEIRAARAGVAVAEVVYETDFRRLQVTASKGAADEQSVLLCGFLANPGATYDPEDPQSDALAAQASLSIDFYDPNAGAGWRSVTMRVVDACSGDPLAETPILLDGLSVGSTDTEGNIDLGLLAIGTEHTIAASRSGYRNFSDTFTVPEASSSE